VGFLSAELDRLPISRPSCLTFRRNGNLVVGTVSGRLVELDAGFNLPALDLGIHGRSVHRLVVAPHDDTLIASCADEAAVVVTSVDPAQPHVMSVPTQAILVHLTYLTLLHFFLFISSFNGLSTFSLYLLFLISVSILFLTIYLLVYISISNRCLSHIC